ncbi:hypothetical protein LQ567_06540 [Niabella pedocola]|uniref:SD-repeat containing protein B domain-containing protein n=1 Tax=Niabella pedocola TaxID=1752077 RepID=A0ABS8PMU3_9BACT|nr:hypothetical protein [Niabella pedocola]MCD2422413.1 hypothetical protein [Niabella pedocola]
MLNSYRSVINTGITCIWSLLFLFFTSPSFGQKSLKFENGGGPSGNGPTTSNQVVTMYNGDAGVYTPATTVTFSLSNQQYPSIQGANSPGVTFGGNVSSNTNTPGGLALYNLMNQLGSSQNSHYSTGGANPTINIANDYAVELFGCTDALINNDGSNKVPTNTKDIYFADLKLTFNRPVNNPVIHVTGLGGVLGNEGFTNSLELVDAYTVLKLAGSPYFDVSKGTHIYNSASRYGSSSSGTGPQFGASGSVKIAGDNITSLTFRVFLSGDGGGPNWSNTSGASGDAILVAVTMTTYNIGGKVFQDANGMGDNTVNGTGTNAGSLNAVLVDPATGNVVATVPVNADGTYSFTNIVAAGYTLAITKDAPVIGAHFPGVSLPEGWTSTGENNGARPGNDGRADGMLSLNLNDNISDANLAMEQQPVSENVSQRIPIPSSHTIPQGSITTPVKGTDPEDGALGNGDTVAITELPTNGTLLYDGNPVAAGQRIPNFDPRLLSFSNLQDGTSSTSFKYSVVDAAGKQSTTPATFTVSWDGNLPVVYKNVAARFSGGSLIIEWTTMTETGNDHFEIEASSDGSTFNSIGTVASKAPDGNSTKEIDYNFSKPATVALFFVAGTSVFGLLGLLLVALNRKNGIRWAAGIIMFVGFLGASCKKKESLSLQKNENVFVRIVQIDKDGKRGAVSKVVRVSSE